MKTHRVLIVGNNSLFHAGLESLLSDELNLSVVRFSNSKIENLVRYIWHILPDVIVISRNEAIEPVNLLQNLDGYPDVRIIEVDEMQNVLQVFDKRRAVATSQMDFMAIVQSKKTNFIGIRKQLPIC